MTKSFVTMETKFCPICGKEWQTGDILMDRNILRERFERTTCTGIALCQEHQAKVDSGEWIALFEAKQTIDHSKGTIIPEPTGSGALLKREVAMEIFGVDVAPISYAEVDILQKLQEMTTNEVPK